MKKNTNCVAYCRVGSKEQLMDIKTTLEHNKELEHSIESLAKCVMEKEKEALRRRSIKGQEFAIQQKLKKDDTYNFIKIQQKGRSIL